MPTPGLSVASRPLGLIAHDRSNDHDARFMERHDQVLSWALRLTYDDRLTAEDLVHDAFVQFTLVRPPLDALHNLDGYLYVMVRNLHLSAMRKATWRRDEPLSLIEYDCAEMGLRTADPLARL